MKYVTVVLVWNALFCKEETHINSNLLNSIASKKELEIHQLIKLHNF